MDFKALMQKLEKIDKKQNLMEAEKKETTWTDKSGKKHPATQVKGDKYTGKEAESEQRGRKSEDGPKSKYKKYAVPDVEESLDVEYNGLAHQLLKEFGLGEKVTLPADGSTPKTQTVNGVTSNAPAEFKFSPEQEKWLGGANRQDPYILARMPGPKPPVSYFKDPADQEIAKKMNFGQDNLNSIKRAIGMKPGDAQTFADPSTAKPAATPAPAAAKPVDNKDPTNPSSVAAVNGSDLQSDQAAAKSKDSGTIDPAKLNRFKELLAKAGQTAAAPGAATGVNAQGQNVTMPDGTNPETGMKA